MTARMPPIPPANRSPKGHGGETQTAQDTTIRRPEPENTAEQGETANIRQNTSNKGAYRAGHNK